MTKLSQRALAAEFIGTFMLMSSVLGAAFYSFGAPAGAAGILGVALLIGFTVMALAFAIGHISGADFNPAVTIGLIAGGRVAANSAVGYILAQCLGAIAACAVFWTIGASPAGIRRQNGYDAIDAEGRNALGLPDRDCADGIPGIRGHGKSPLGTCRQDLLQSRSAQHWPPSTSWPFRFPTRQ